MPPVGMNFTPVWPNGPASAFSALTPPNVSDGKNFKCFQPSCSAHMISDGVMTPGNNGRSVVCAAADTDSLKPGETPNCAPASTACLTLSAVNNVPAPTIICGT